MDDYIELQLKFDRLVKETLIPNLCSPPNQM